MSARNRVERTDEEGPWWRLDFTMVMVLLVAIVLLLLITFEFWHRHPGLHLE